MKTDKEILRFIETYMIVHGYAPSFREIGIMMEVKTKKAVVNQIEKMIEAGLLETYHPGEDRAIMVPGYCWAKSEYKWACGECGEECPPNSKYCWNCGREFNN